MTQTTKRIAVAAAMTVAALGVVSAAWAAQDSEYLDLPPTTLPPTTLPPLPPELEVTRPPATTAPPAAITPETPEQAAAVRRLIAYEDAALARRVKLADADLDRRIAEASARLDRVLGQYGVHAEGRAARSKAANACTLMAASALEAVLAMDARFPVVGLREVVADVVDEDTVHKGVPLFDSDAWLGHRDEMVRRALDCRAGLSAEEVP